MHKHYTLFLNIPCVYPNTVVGLATCIYGTTLCTLDNLCSQKSLASMSTRMNSTSEIDLAKDHSAESRAEQALITK